MTEKRTEDMIHEALESGGSITQTKGHDQKIIVALMSSKGSLRNVCLFHIDMMVVTTKIKFSKELGTTQFIQEICSVPFTTQVHPTSQITIHYMNLKGTNAFNQN